MAQIAAEKTRRMSRVIEVSMRGDGTVRDIHIIQNFRERSFRLARVRGVCYK
jgi:hypothetical protein